jgi:hypothetical protein
MNQIPKYTTPLHLQVFGGVQKKSRIYKSTMQQSRHVDVFIINRPLFECKFYGNLFKDKKYFVLPQNDEFMP